ncbi:MAG: sigma-70 family RNA polymerase sigma factor [Planctomycetota bacterium]|jgi:RNA polymerase sigma-70 factor (ECF subfamily)
MDIIQQQSEFNIVRLLYPENVSLKKQSKKELYLSEFSQASRRIYAFILTYVPNHADAADIMQETAMLLWKKFDSFRPGSNFSAWAIAVARNKILKLRSVRFDKRIRFDSEIVDLFNPAEAGTDDQFDLRKDILKQCVEKLSPCDAELIDLKYEKRMSVVDIAKVRKRPLQGLYKTMARIHRNLRDCVSINLKLEQAHE